MSDVLELKQALSTTSADEHDVRATKHILNRLGYYTPHADIGITGMTDRNLFDAIKKFQSDHKLSVTGSLRPDDDTVNTINRAIEDQPIPTQYIWHTVQDDKVRSSHAAREGKVFSWLEHPIPGEDFNCRCWAEPFEGKQSVEQIYDPGTVTEYPELDLIAFLSGAKLARVVDKVFISQAVEWLIRNKAEAVEKLGWQLGSHKSAEKWLNRLEKGEWLKGGVKKNIDEVLRNGRQFKAPNDVNQGSTATRFEYKGRFIVCDNQTKDILQVSRPGDFKPRIMEE